MLVVEPERRLSITQILEHAWMNGRGAAESESGRFVIFTNQLFIECQ